MEGKRFGFGLVAGLLLGVVVVVASAGFGTGSIYGSLGSRAQEQITAVTTATSSTLTQAATTSGQPPFATNSGNSSTLQPSSGTTATTASYPTGGLVPSSGNALNSALSSLSSNVDNLPHQPLLSNAVIFIPVFIAFLLGAFLYTASRQPDEEES